MSGASGPSSRGRLLSSLGPAIITASVVLGPGSILSASKTGYQYGYQMAWVLVVAALLMVGMTALSARLGVVLEGTLCEELARRAGRWLAVLTGAAVFLIVACFQFGNNLGVLAAIEPFYAGSKLWPLVIIVNLNLLIVVALYGFRSLYSPVERTMMLMVGLMVVAFAVNLFYARPDWGRLAEGLRPQLGQEALETLVPRWQEPVVKQGQVVQAGQVVDRLLPVVALFATTFSVAGAFYQSYLVRQKGWSREHLRQGLMDAAVGISVLGLITLMIMVTAAAVLHGKPGLTFRHAGDVARQLEPLFGPLAAALFCTGILAGALSSFMVNAMIGGSMLADGLGLGGYLDQRWPKFCTVLALAVGMNVALWVQWSGQRPVNLIIFAQAVTVLGFPVLAAGMLWLATRPDLTGPRRVPMWLKLLGTAGLLVTLFLAVRTGVRIYLQLAHNG